MWEGHTLCVWLKHIPAESWLNPDLLFEVPELLCWWQMGSATAQGESEGRPVKNPRAGEILSCHRRYSSASLTAMVRCNDETQRSCPLTPSLSHSHKGDQTVLWWWQWKMADAKENTRLWLIIWCMASTKVKMDDKCTSKHTGVGGHVKRRS